MDHAPRYLPRTGHRALFPIPPAGRRRRGTALVEALVFMGVISIIVAAFTASAIAATRAQRDQHTVDIASQASQGLQETAKSLSWNQLAFLASDPGYVSSYEGRPTVTVASFPPGTNRITPVMTKQVRGVTVTLTTYITWLATPTAQNAGTKRITTIVSWTEDGHAKTMRYTSDRSSTVNEAPPATSIPSGFGANPPVVPTPVVNPSGTATEAYDGHTGYEYDGYKTGGPTGVGDVPDCPDFTVDASIEGTVTLTWDTITAASYQIKMDGTLLASPAAGQTTYTNPNISGGSHAFTMYAVWYGVPSTGCTQQTVTVTPAIIPACPTTTATGGTGDLTVSWSAVANALGYNVYVDGSLWASVTGTSYVATPLSQADHTVKVTSTRYGHESPGCTTKTVTVATTAADCATITNYYGQSDGSLTVTWTAGARAISYPLYVDGVLKATPSSKLTSYTVTGLAPGNHTFKLNSNSADGTTTDCPQRGFTVPGPSPSCPGVTLSGAGSTLTVTWTSAANATEYDLFVDNSYVGAYGAAGSYSRSGLSGTHYAEVDTYNSTYGTSTACGRVYYTFTSPAPSCPTMSAAGGINQGTFTWGTGANTTSYQTSIDAYNAVTYSAAGSRTVTGLSPGTHQFGLSVSGPGGTTTCGMTSFTVTAPAPPCPSVVRAYSPSTQVIAIDFWTLSSSTYGTVSYKMFRADGTTYPATSGSPVSASMGSTAVKNVGVKAINATGTSSGCPTYAVAADGSG